MRCINLAKPRVGFIVLAPGERPARWLQRSAQRAASQGKEGWIQHPSSQWREGSAYQDPATLSEIWRVVADLHQRQQRKQPSLSHHLKRFWAWSELRAAFGDVLSQISAHFIMIAPIQPEWRVPASQASESLIWPCRQPCWRCVEGPRPASAALPNHDTTNICRRAKLAWALKEQPKFPHEFRYQTGRLKSVAK